jgi:hypothetical protein
MAEKKKTKKPAAVTNFNAGRFRMGEERSMAELPAVQAAEQIDLAEQIKSDVAEAERLSAEASQAEIAANQARILAGEQIDIDEADEELTAEKVQQMLADLYAQIQGDALAQKRAAGESAYSLLYEEFSRYGLGALVTPLQKYIQDGISPAEFTIRLRNEPAYKRRFSANESRITQGLRALSEAEYIELEDRYQDIMRRYGMPETYYRTEKDPVTGITLQPGFEKFIAGDVSPVELEDRIQTAYDRVLKANPEVMTSLKQFYGDTINNGDILAYALDTKNAIENIKRKVTAAEIGAGAAMAGLASSRARAEELGAYGVTGQQAREGFQTVAQIAPRGGQLAEIYKQTPYTQATAEQEVFGIAGAVEAAKQRKKLTELETAAFSGQAGTTGGALARERAGAF